MNSLINYLNAAGNKIFLNLLWPSQDLSNVFSRADIGDSDPLGRLIEARVASDAGSEIKKLFLLVQRDAYPLKNNVLWPFNNIDVRNAWQKSFAFYADPKRNDSSFVVLSDQIGKTGEILPFSSLFYCQTKKVFFHPPCPACGRTLQQCEDDGLLRTSGLQPFSTSLRRYLHCPACGMPDFYAYEREPNDPASLKDRRNLIKNFAGLKKAEETAAFPCADCRFHTECYDGENRASERIVPFSFYPFYMLAFDAASLNAMDFIPLLSGAGFPETQLLAENSRAPGRIASVAAVSRACAESPFLFDHDERHFLEILYLKLTFLEEVIRNIQSAGRFAHPDMKPGIDQIWVKFPENCGMLPWFWNFKVRILGVSRDESAPEVFKTTQDCRVLLGLIWFYTLLSNKKQSMSDILNCLKKYLQEDTGSLEKITRENILDASNVFWDPQGKTIPDAWKSFWEKSLNRGWSLLTSDFQAADDAGVKFFDQLAQLRKDIKDNLFLKEIPHAVSAPKEVEAVLPGAQDELIHTILLGLIDKFQSAITEKKAAQALKVSADLKFPAAAKADKTPVPPGDEDIDEPVTETVIFSARPSTREGTVPSAAETQILARHVPSREVPIESQETLILSLNNLKSETKAKDKEADQLEKTLILSTQTAVKETPVPPAEKTPIIPRTVPVREAAVESQETLILSLNDVEPKAKPKAGQADQLEETLILSAQSAVKATPVPPGEKTPDISQAAPVREAPAESQETLILSVGNLDHQKKLKTEKTVPDIEETLILSTLAPGVKATEKAQGETGQKTVSHNNLLDETVILRPGEKSKDGTKK